MQGKPYPTVAAPEYHESMLFVKVRDQGRPSPATIGGRGGATVGAASAPEVAGVAWLARTGLLRRVTSLAPTVPSALAIDGIPDVQSRAAAMLRRTPSDQYADLSPGMKILAGTHLLEMSGEVSLGGIQERLSLDPTIEFVARVPIRYLARPKEHPARAQFAVPGGPEPIAQWNLPKISWAPARAIANFRDAQTIKVAILDTGADLGHPNLVGRVTSYVWNYPDLPGPSSDQDLVGHGTHVSGIVSALINNGVGVDGVCQCQLLVYKIFTDEAVINGDSTSFVYYVDPVMYQRALAACVDNGATVINLSIGGTGAPDPIEQQLFSALLSNGVTVVAAMGNERQSGSPISYPAAISGVVAVGATSADDSVAIFSNRGNHIALAAPGVAIWSTLPRYPGQVGFEAVNGPGGLQQGKPIQRKTDYDAWDGTSMATPHVTAAVALLVANKGKTTPSNAKSALMATADKVPGMAGTSFHPDFGAGRLNLLKLLR